MCLKNWSSNSDLYTIAAKFKEIADVFFNTEHFFSIIVQGTEYNNISKHFFIFFLTHCYINHKEIFLIFHVKLRFFTTLVKEKQI